MGNGFQEIMFIEWLKKILKEIAKMGNVET